MTIIFAISLAVFVILGIFVLLIGPEKAEKAIKVLFKVETYQEAYHRIYPTERYVYQPDSYASNVSGAEKNLLGVYKSRNVVNQEESYPLIVPTTGITPVHQFLYTGPNAEGGHEGIDIWTNSNGTGLSGEIYDKGNPVYAACDGKVSNVWEENGDVSIICDPLDQMFEEKVPSLEVKTLYGHMADQFSDEVFILVAKGDKIQKGDLIGYQGNRCYYAPENRVVHLHFGVYDVRTAIHKPMNPEAYIGVSCTTLNQTFKEGVSK